MQHQHSCGTILKFSVSWSKSCKALRFAPGGAGSNMVIGFACQRPKGDSHFAFASLLLQLFLHIHQRHFATITSFHMYLCYDVKLAISASKRRANQKSLVDA